MARACWVVCVAMFAALALACGGAGSKSTSTEGLKRTGGEPDTDPVTRALGTGEPVVIGGLKVVIVSAAVAEVDLGRDKVSAEKHLVVTVSLTSVDPGKKFDYRTWAESGVARDDLGNQYRASFFAVTPAGRKETAQVYSDQTVRDVLVFERPVAAAKHIDLDLPAPFDGGQVFRFRLLVSDIAK